MRILIDGSRVLIRNKAGIGHYTYELIKHLSMIDHGNEYTILVSTKNPIDLPQNIRRIQSKKWNLRYIPFDVERIKGKFHIYHEPNYIPRVFDGKIIVTIHDMSYRLYPQYHPYRRIALLRFFEHRMRAADKIITVSYNAKKEIMDILKVPEEKVSVVYNGVSKRFKPMKLSNEQKSIITEVYNLPEQFLLYIGTIEPRKNLVRLLEAFHQVKSELNIKELKLVLGGAKGWLYEDIFDRIRDLKLEQDIIITGYLPDEQLPILYNMALAFVYPSLYEGFGIPPLEAMACGVPVIGSNVSSLPEIIGEAGILIDPNEVNDLSDAIFRVVTSVELRQSMSQRGLVQAGKFSWDDCARGTLLVYKSCERDE